MNSRNHSLSARVAEIALEGSGRWKFVRVDDLGGRCEVCHLPLVFVAHLENELTGRKVTLGLDCLNRFVGFSQIKAQAKAARDLLELERTGRAVELLPLLPDLERLSASTLLSERQRIQAGDFFRAIKSGRLRVLMDGQREWIEQMQAKLNVEITIENPEQEQVSSQNAKSPELDSVLNWLGSEMAVHPESKLSDNADGISVILFEGLESDGGFVGSIKGSSEFKIATDLWLITNPEKMSVVGVDISFSNTETNISEGISARICQPSQASFRGTKMAWFARVAWPFVLAPISDIMRPKNLIPVSHVNVAVQVDDGQVSKNLRWSGFVFRIGELQPESKKVVMSKKGFAGRTTRLEARLRSGHKLSPSDIKFLQENAPELLKQFNL
jgi:hypothetical protein